MSPRAPKQEAAAACASLRWGEKREGNASLSQFNIQPVNVPVCPVFTKPSEYHKGKGYDRIPFEKHLTALG